MEPASATEKEVSPKTKTTEPAAKETLAISDTLATNRAQRKVTLIKTHEGRQIYIDVAASPIFQDTPTNQPRPDLTLPAPKKMVGIIVVIRDVDKQQREEVVAHVEAAVGRVEERHAALIRLGLALAFAARPKEVAQDDGAGAGEDGEQRVQGERAVGVKHGAAIIGRWGRASRIGAMSRGVRGRGLVDSGEKGGQNRAVEFVLDSGAVRLRNLINSLFN